VTACSILITLDMTPVIHRKKLESIAIDNGITINKDNIIGIIENHDRRIKRNMTLTHQYAPTQAKSKHLEEFL